MADGLRVLLAGFAAEGTLRSWEKTAAVHRVHVVPSLAKADAWLHDVQADALVVLLDPLEIETLTQLRAAHPDIALVVVIPEGAPTLPIVAAGADELLVGPLRDHIRSGDATRALETALVRRRGVNRTIQAAIEASQARVAAAVDRQIGDLWNAASHELATPMMPLLMDIRGLKQGADPEGQEIVARLQRNIERLGEAVRRLQASRHDAKIS